MKILVVSAHFPPNFVSGGTLAPQRQARGLRALGHDVSVYAGWLGDRPGLEVWSEVDETGLPVRWVSSRPWIGWDDRNNFDNPGVTDDFRSHVAEVQPDVVHFHSMQSLGAGLLDVAADAGAKVVVTMHDFWWFCARQFLVDRDYHPCCLVVSCGDCPCQIDRDWLAGRNQFLADRLARADLILAVSSSSAEVLAANGIESARLRIDENGVPAPAAGEQANGVDARPAAEAAPGSAATDGGTGVRFTFAGGPDRMKGVHVLIEAARQLTDRHGSAGWTIRAYGVGPYLEESGEHVENLPFDARPAFDPQDAEAVFAATDVLVVPSVMRETYSILTREALARRVPVITTDTIGPEEVVEHGRNGLVVAADDAVGLAGAMAQVVDDPHLLATLRQGCAGLVVRSVEEQVAGLDLLYQGLLAPPTAPVPARAEIRRVVFMAGIEGAPLRYRARLPAEGLAMLAIESAVRHYRSADLPGLLEEADAVVVYRVPATVQVLGLIEQVRERGVPVFFDVDDLIFDPDLAAEIPALTLLPPDEADLWMEGVRRYRTTMEACDAFIGSTERLCRHAEEVVGLRAHRFDNGVGIRLARASEEARAKPRSPGPLRIGYLSGTNTHDSDWRFVEPAVAEVLAAREDLELWLGGLVTPTRALDPFADRVRRLPFTPWLELPAVLRDLDVNLAPLEPGSRFNEAKSAIKWLEAALTATPTIASPTEPFREVIRTGENGMLAEHLPDWRDAIVRLVDDPAGRARMGQRARRDALLSFSPHRQGERYLSILEQRPDRGRRPSSWPVTAHDEPLVEVALEHYGPQPCSEPAVPSGADVAVPIPSRKERMRGLLRRGRRSLREDGVRTAVGKAVAVGRRQVPKVARRLRNR